MSRISKCEYWVLCYLFIWSAYASVVQSFTQRLGSTGRRKAEPRTSKKHVDSDFCDYLPGNSLINQDDNKICTMEQLENMNGKWLPRDFSCDWGKWYEKIDPLGQSKIYTNNISLSEYSCLKSQAYTKSNAALRYRFSPSKCRLLRFNPGHALEIINNGCTSPLFFLGDERIKNLAKSWQNLVGLSNENNKAVVKFHHLKHFEPLTWLQHMPKMKTLVVTLPLYEGGKVLFDAKKFNLDNYRQKIHKILSTIDKTPISTVVFFVAPKNRIVAESTPFCKPEEIKGTRTMQIIKIWKNSFEKYKKTLFRILDVRDISKSWPGPGAYSHDGKCKYCLPGLPDTWSHILFNMLHHTHIQCEIEDFEEVSKHVTLHEALYGAMGMGQAR